MVKKAVKDIKEDPIFHDKNNNIITKENLVLVDLSDEVSDSSIINNNIEIHGIKKFLVGEIIDFEIGEDKTIKLRTIFTNVVEFSAYDSLYALEKHISIITDELKKLSLKMIDESFLAHIKEQYNEPEKKIRGYESMIADSESRIKSYEDSIKELKERTEELKRDKAFNENKLKDRPSLKKFIKENEPILSANGMINQILKSKRVRNCYIDLHRGRPFLVVETEMLPYKGHNVSYENFGEFLIFIDLMGMSTGGIYIRNKTQTINKMAQHPCIKVDPEQNCWGGSVKDSLYELFASKNLASMVDIIIAFLISPNYGTPYFNEILFAFAQKTEWNPENVFNWIDRSEYEKNVNWDEEPYQKLFSELDSGIIYINADGEIKRRETNSNESNEEEEEDEEMVF